MCAPMPICPPIALGAVSPSISPIAAMSCGNAGALNESASAAARSPILFMRSPRREASFAIALQACVSQCRQLAAHALLVLEIDRRDDDALLIGGAGNHASPRTDDHRIAVVAVAVDVGAELSRCDHIRLVLDRAGAQQGLPMRLAGGEGERARDSDNLCAGESEAAIEFREAKVIADAESDRAERSRAGDDLGAGEFGVGFAHRYATREVDVKQMNLA